MTTPYNAANGSVVKRRGRPPSRSTFAADLTPATVDAHTEETTRLTERRVGVSARLVVLQALCDTRIDVLRRAELGLRAVATFEGSKQSIWHVVSRDEPKTVEEYDEARREAETRLHRLLGMRDKMPTLDAAVAALDREDARKALEAEVVVPPPD